jgi:hypothetical protein
MVDYFNFRNKYLTDNNYYSSDEIIELARKIPFVIDDPFMKIRRGTIIHPHAILENNTHIYGDDVTIGEYTRLSEARIMGSKIRLGKTNLVNGKVEPDNITIGDRNTICGLTGINKGNAISIGDGNQIENIRITVSESVEVSNRPVVRIGNSNYLHSGLNCNVPFKRGFIFIGNNNQLGRDGGGVISSSYRFNKGQYGSVIIGSNVETTRGAEILGWSLLGIAKSDMESLTGREGPVEDLFVNKNLTEINKFFERAYAILHSGSVVLRNPDIRISLFGIVKVKRTFIGDIVKLKDGIGTFRSVLSGCEIAERNNIYSTIIQGNGIDILKNDLQGKCMEALVIRESIDWSSLPEHLNDSEYPATDIHFYKL